MNIAVLTANIVAWPIIQLSIARVSLYLPNRYFDSRRLPSYFEMQEVAFYRQTLRIRKWKHLLPDGASWISGTFSKSRITSHNPDYLLRVALEARRGELAHWAMLLCFPLFYLWNPTWACVVMTTYALVTNLPCIVVQRYNRFVILGRLASHRVWAAS